MSKCKICKAEFIKRSMTHKTCSLECAVKFVQKEKSKKERVDFLERKQKLKSRSDWLKDMQIVFNRFIRTRDAGLPCISCGRNSGAKTNAGHFLSVGSHPQLRFNEKNTHLQCEHCNTYLSGNIHKYRPALIDKIGLEAVESLECNQAIVKWSIDDLKAIKSEFKEKLKALIK